ncbi:MAG: flagellar basal-body MS-ring/collar protein FliF [Gemmobacter sp.]
MQQLFSLWSAFDLRRRIVVVGATVGVFMAVLVLGRMVAQPQMALLYAGLEPAAAGEVMRALDQRGTAYEVRGESIWVPAALRDPLRMSLAGEGLPANGPAGYELLDQLSGFGTTSQMFDAAYLRAKEGELARTIAASPSIRTARVHIALPQAQPFRRELRASASVTVTPAAGAVLPAAQARALRYLVASAVAGLSPEDVAVIDGAAGLVLTEETGGSGRAADDRAAELKRNVERIVAARVGAGRAVVEVSVDLERERESIVERRVDPRSRVAISSETEERTASASGQTEGVTVASNLPEGDASGKDRQRSQTSETRERVNYEVSEVSRQLQRDPGGVRRITVAVLVDGIRADDGSWIARPADELGDLRELVAAAIGFDAARGDQITVKSMQFDMTEARGSAPPAPLLSGLDWMVLIQTLVAAGVALVLGLFVLRPLLVTARRLSPPPPLSLPSALPDGGLTGEIDTGGDGPAPRLAAPAHPRAEAEVGAEDPVERLRRLIAERQTESIEILRGWMDEHEEAR